MKKKEKSIKDLKPSKRREIICVDNIKTFKNKEIEKKLKKDLLGIATHGVPYLGYKYFFGSEEKEGLLIPIEIAEKNFKFKPGHPKNNCLYMLHPLDSKMYLSKETFLKEIYEEKWRYFIKMLNDLGIKSIEARHIKGKKELGGVKFEAKSKGTVLVGGGIGRKGEKKSDYILIASYEPEHKAHKPEENIWLEHEHTWESIVHQVMKGKLKYLDFEYTFNLSDILEGNLEVPIEEINLNAGFLKGFSKNNEFKLKLKF